MNKANKTRRSFLDLPELQEPPRRRRPKTETFSGASMVAQPKYHALPRHHLLHISNSIRETLDKTPYNPPEAASVSIKSLIQTLLPRDITDLCLWCAALASADGEDSPAVYWIPRELSAAARSAFREDSFAAGYDSERDMVAELMHEAMPMLKGVIKESCIDPDDEDIVAGSAKAPVEGAILAAHQFRWLVTQVCYPYLGKACSLIIPCALTALDHWSPQVKDQGMLGFIHLAKNVTAAELGWYEDAILDACHRNIASSDELWHRVVETSVLLLTSTQQGNPRSSWFECILNEMLSHLERQPLNKERRIAWLQLIEPVFEAMGLVILAHFRRIFYLFFQWMHVDDDQTVLLVFERLQPIIKLTWIRKSPYFERLVDELVLLYKEVATRKSREVLRGRILGTLIVLQKCKGMQFETAWIKHKNDPDLAMLISCNWRIGLDVAPCII